MKNLLLIKTRERKEIQIKDSFTPFKNENGIIQPQEISELQGSLIELNKDDYNFNSRKSSIDMRTRLYNTEIASILCIDTLINFSFLPSSIIGLTDSKKRLNVSLLGQGRAEMVQVIGGKREQDMGGGFMNKFTSIFRPQQP